jgi:phenylalanyl-tRNA synthetase beta subunit
MNGFKIEIPTYRADVLRPIDLIEEFLRIYSYNKISFSEQVSCLTAQAVYRTKASFEKQNF